MQDLMPVLITTLMLGACTMLVPSCSETNYYRVTDVSSGKAYYTTKVATVGRTVQIQDERTGSMMTLQFYEVQKITEDEYESGIMAEPPAGPAPVPPEWVRPDAVHTAPIEAAL